MSFFKKKHIHKVYDRRNKKYLVREGFSDTIIYEGFCYYCEQYVEIEEYVDVDHKYMILEYFKEKK